MIDDQPICDYTDYYSAVAFNQCVASFQMI